MLISSGYACGCCRRNTSFGLRTHLIDFHNLGTNAVAGTTWLHVGGDDVGGLTDRLARKRIQQCVEECNSKKKHTNNIIVKDYVPMRK